jgi:surfeit locus 1 family protein
MSARSSRGFVLMTALALAVLAMLISLGTWQVNRLAWKEDLIRDIETRTQAAPIAFANWLTAKAGEDYWPVTVSGQFRHDGERHFFATHNGQSGYFVYTPLETAPGTFVFVNRGFVPFDRKNPATRTDGQIAGPVTITGLARSVLAGKPSQLVPDNDPAKNQFYWKDLAAMSTSAGLAKNAKVERGFIDADQSATPVSGLPQGGVTLIELPNNHLQYAVTWYGLAATLAVIWSVLAFRHFRP